MPEPTPMMRAPAKMPMKRPKAPKMEPAVTALVWKVMSAV